MSRGASSIYKLEMYISRFLRAGVLFAGFLLLLGWAGMLRNSGDILASFQNYQRQSLSEALQWALVMNDGAMLIAFAGLGVLVLLPVLRVFMTGFIFLGQKEYKMAALAAFVFAALVGSFFFGIDL